MKTRELLSATALLFGCLVFPVFSEEGGAAAADNSEPQLVSLDYNRKLTLSLKEGVDKADYLVALPGRGTLRVSVFREGGRLVTRLSPDGFEMKILGSGGEDVASLKTGDSIDVSGLIDPTCLMTMITGPKSPEEKKGEPAGSGLLEVRLGAAPRLSVFNSGDSEVLVAGSQPEAEPEMLSSAAQRDIMLGYELVVPPKEDVTIPFFTMPAGKSALVNLPNGALLSVAVSTEDLGGGMRMFVTGWEPVEIELNEYTILRLMPGDGVALPAVANLNADSDGSLWFAGGYQLESVHCLAGMPEILVGDELHDRADPNAWQSFTIPPAHEYMLDENGIPDVVLLPPEEPVVPFGEELGPLELPLPALEELVTGLIEDFESSEVIIPGSPGMGGTG